MAGYDSENKLDLSLEIQAAAPLSDAGSVISLPIAGSIFSEIRAGQSETITKCGADAEDLLTRDTFYFSVFARIFGAQVWEIPQWAEMADDGMLVNFSVDPVQSKNVPKYKGGSWRERTRLNRIAKTRTTQRGLNGARTQDDRKDVSNDKAPHAIEDDGDFSDPRPSKKRRENGPLSEGRDTANMQAPRPYTKPKPKEIVSSLFSYNPSPSTIVQNADEMTEQPPSKPTNAPLPDGIDTFTSLGLSTSLAAHLLSKMNLKNPTSIQKRAVTQLLKEDTDAFIQSETGSGKTLAYLLPIVQRLATISKPEFGSIRSTTQDGKVHRDSGLFAIILAPTRELCKQISVVLERLLGCAHWVVAGTVIGGEKKKSEKARLRKGLNILVATPGRLVDHLDNTKVLKVSSVRWLILDEGDRLMDLGFEEDISKIVKALDERQTASSIVGLPERRTTVLCSATMKMNVQKLGDISLKDAILIKSDDGTEEPDTENGTKRHNTGFLAPAQLKQSYVVVAAKLRLVTLAALLKRTFARKGSVMKAIVFVSCADSIEFHFKALTRQPFDDKEKNEADSAAEESPATADKPHQSSVSISTLLSTPANPLTLYKLHGSLPQPLRTSILKAFSTSTTPSLLIATDVASRGLDLPNLDLVIEYDPPFSSDDHLHRIGRTARLGRDGRAVIFLLPGCEEGYVDVLTSSYKTPLEGTRAVTQSSADDILKKGFSSTSGLNSASTIGWQQKATEFQLEIERWVLSSAANQELARKAFQSHMRAYATHVAAERRWFDIKELHLGHLAKAFGLRDAPGRINVAGLRGAAAKKVDGKRRRTVNGSRKDDGAEMNESTAESELAARKMKALVRNKKMIMGGGADEFNIA